MKTILALGLVILIFLAGCNVQLPSTSKSNLAMKKFTSEEELTDYKNLPKHLVSAVIMADKLVLLLQ